MQTIKSIFLIFLIISISIAENATIPAQGLNNGSNITMQQVTLPNNITPVDWRILAIVISTLTLMYLLIYKFLQEFFKTAIAIGFAILLIATTYWWVAIK